MQQGLRGTQGAAIKIVDAIGRGGAAPAAERQIIISGLSAARDALARLDSYVTFLSTRAIEHL